MNHISHVSIFLEVVKHESFAGAARALGMTSPAISKQIQSLEKKLGVKLLNRSTRHVALSEEGAVYYERARKALEDLHEAEQQIQELKDCPTGKLKVSAPMSFGTQYLTQPIAQFAKSYPDVKLEIDFSDRWVDVIGDGYDVIIRIASLKDSNLIARKLAPCPIVLCASTNFIKTHGQPKHVRDIENYPAIVYNQHGQKEQWNYLDETQKQDSITLNRTLAANSAEMQLEACIQGLGVALLPIFSAHEYIKSGELIHLYPELITHPVREIYAMYPQNRFLSTRTRLFIESLVKTSESFPWF